MLKRWLLIFLVLSINTMDKVKKFNILVATGIYPPDIGGPAKYAQMLVSSAFEEGHFAKAISFGSYLKYPTIIRHFLYFFKLLPSVYRSDFIIALDTFSVCLPAYIASKIFRKKIIIRTGGDFLWESYLDRTKEYIKLSNFYKQKRNFNLKEKIIFNITKKLLNRVCRIVFSTKYQMDIFIEAYKIDKKKTIVIENFYGTPPKRNIIPKQKNIIAPFRDTFLKNKYKILKAEEILKKRFVDINIDFSIHTGQDFNNHLHSAYCVLIPSISEISPNLAIDAVTAGIPVILTEDCGIRDRLDGFVLWTNPEDPNDIADNVSKLLDNKEYSTLVSKLSRFNFSHTGREIILEFIKVFKEI